MTIAEFCANEGLTASTYRYWQREIQRRDAESPMPKSDPAERTTFVPVQLLDDGNGAAPVEIVARNGYVVRVSEVATADHVRRVLQAVSELD
jgi:predicted RNA-binding protein with TRAM domain